MSTPQGAGGRTFNLAAGADATLLAANVDTDTPLTIINTGQNRAYLAGDSNSSPNTATPLEAGTQQPWSSAGQVWAFTTDGPTTVVITSATSDWQPSPYALTAAAAAATAALLFEQGVPSVLTVDIVADVSIPAGATRRFDVRRYGSLVIISGGSDMSYFFDDGNGNRTDGDTLDLGNSATDVIRLAVAGLGINIVNDFALANDLIIVGSNRAALDRYDVRNTAANGDSYNRGAGNLVAGNVVVLPSNYGAALQGGCYLNARITGITCKGVFEMVYTDGSGIIVSLCDTSEFATQADNSLRYYNGHCAAPAQAVTIQFRCTVAGSGVSLRLTLIPDAL